MMRRNKRRRILCRTSAIAVVSQIEGNRTITGKQLEPAVGLIVMPSDRRNRNTGCRRQQKPIADCPPRILPPKPQQAAKHHRRKQQERRPEHRRHAKYQAQRDYTPHQNSPLRIAAQRQHPQPYQQRSHHRLEAMCGNLRLVKYRQRKHRPEHSCHPARQFTKSPPRNSKYQQRSQGTQHHLNHLN